MELHLQVTFAQLLSNSSLLITFLCTTLRYRVVITEVVPGSALQVLKPGVSGTAQIRPGWHRDSPDFTFWYKLPNIFICPHFFFYKVSSDLT